MAIPAVTRALGRLPWSGETVVCVASGPSAAGVDLEPARGRARVIVINDSWRLCPWADLLYGCDGAWWMREHNPVRGWPANAAFAGLRVTQDPAAAQRHGLRLVSVTRGVNRILTDHPGVLGSGGNGGFQALNIAVQAGAARVVLVGYDMRVDLGAHWHGDHPSGLNNPKPTLAARWAAALDDQGPRLTALGVEVLNASPISALTAFRKASLTEALDDGRTQLQRPARRDMGAAL